MSGGGRDLSALEADVERHREELAETIDQLSAKLDVKSRVRDRVTTDDGRPTPGVLAAGGVAFVVVGTLVFLAIRRGKR